MGGTNALKKAFLLGFFILPVYQYTREGQRPPLGGAGLALKDHDPEAYKGKSLAC